MATRGGGWLLRALVTLLLVTLLLAPTTEAQFQFQFDDMFGGGGDPFNQGGDGGGGGGGRPRKQKEEIEKGYLCPDTQDVVDHPVQCPCPGYKMTKCKMDDWYVCVPAGTKCLEGKFNKMDKELAEDEFDEDE